MSCKSYANGVNGQSDWPWDLPIDRLDGPHSNRGCAATGCPKKRHFYQRCTFQKMSCKSHTNGVNGQSDWPWDLPMDRLDGPNTNRGCAATGCPRKRHFCQRRTFQKMSCKSHANGVNGQSDWPWDLPMDLLDGPNTNRGCAATGCPRNRHFCQRRTF